MEPKRTKIEIPKGYEIDKEQSTFEEIVFKPITKGFLKTWEELEFISGYYNDGSCFVKEVTECEVNNFNKNIFATKEQAEASIALAQLSQLMKVYNDGWNPDWTNTEDKYVIFVHSNEIRAEYYTFIQRFLAFKTLELRDNFLENFKDLILTAKPLL